MKKVDSIKNCFHKKPDKISIIFGLASVVWAAGIFTMSSIPASGLPANLGLWSNAAHFFEYAVLAALISFTIGKPDDPPWKTALIAVAIAAAYGATDEFHQWFVEGRATDIRDWLTDIAGAAVGAAAAVLAVKTRNTRD